MHDKKAYMREYRQRPEIKARKKEQDYRYRQKAKTKEMRKGYEQNPKRKEYKRKFMREYMKKWREENPEQYKLRKEKDYASKQERRHKLKQELVALLGGSCRKCGYSKYVGALDFAHKNGNEKEAVVGDLIQLLQKEKAIKEINKCILLCNRCHKELDAGLWKLEDLGT